MRKRSRGRGVNSRGGRGVAASSRVNKEKLAVQLPQRQSELTSSTIKLIRESNHRDSQSSYLNGTNCRSREPKRKNGFAVNSFASIMENAAAVIDLDQKNFYLHKKFKKLSSTNDIINDSNNDKSEEIPAKGNSEDKLPIEFERKRKNGTVVFPIPNFSDIATNGGNRNQTFDDANLSMHSNRKDKETNNNPQMHTSDFLSNVRSLPEVQFSPNTTAKNPIPSSTTSISRSTNSTKSISQEAQNITSNNNINGSGNSTTVYKPKFHKIIASSSTTEEVNNRGQLSIQNISSNNSFQFSKISPTPNSSTCYMKPLPSVAIQQQFPSTSVTNGRKSMTATTVTIPPGKISGDRRRIDRQSLDDRISKIIDENQSILATLPEFSRRQRSHHNSGSSNNSYNSLGSSSSSRLLKSPTVNMSGGTTTEFDAFNMSLGSSATTGFDLSLRKSSMPQTTTKPKTILVRSQSDLSESLLTRNLHLMSPSPSSLSLPSLDNNNRAMLDRRQDKFGQLNHETAVGEEQFIVPKKRRKLSPAAFCGGEVSDLSAQTQAAIAKNLATSSMQDVDMTVRVSNCSGAQVTVKANSNSSNSTRKLSLPSSSGGYVSVVEDGLSRSNVYQSHKIIMGGKPTTSALPNFSSMITSHFNEQDKQRMLNIDDQAIDLKVGKPRGRPPKKNGMIATVNRKISDSVLNLSTATFSQVPISQGRKSTTVLPSSSLLDIRTTNGINASPNNGIPKIQNLSMLKHPISATIPTKPSAILKSANSPSSDVSLTDKNICLEKPSLLLSSNSVTNPKRPNFLALKPMNPSLKKNCFDSSLVLPSPDTPRGAKPCNQMYLNGHAYTYLGFKVSTRTSYTCLFRPQPMFIPQENDPKLSMYSNWQPRPKDPNLINSISTNDSSVNGRKCSIPMLYVSAIGKNCRTMTSSSSDKQTQILSTVDSKYVTLIKGSVSGQSDIVNTAKSSHSSPVERDSISNIGLSTTSCLTAPASSSQSSPSPALSLSHDSMSHHRNRSLSEMKGNESSSSSSVMSKVSRKSRKRLMNRNEPSSSKIIDNSSNSNEAPNSGIYRRPILHLQNVQSSNSDFSGSADDESNGSNSRLDNFRRISQLGRTSQKHEQRNDSPLPFSTSRSNDNNDLSLKGNDESTFSPNSFNANSSEQAKVRVIEGGFESNEDYTYVRGRGRGRYVCEACGIRCKKPSMLRKHLKTHTDLRPYTCKLCNFSFKTKGNLTKHQKSKSHHKKCFGLGIDPKSSRSLAMIGPTSDTDDDDSEDDDGDDDEEMDSNDDEAGLSSSQDMEPENDSFEKEIAQSLLDLSRMTTFGKTNNEETRRLAIESNAEEKVLSLERQPLSMTVKQQQIPKEVVVSSLNSTSRTLPETAIDLSVKNNSKPSDLISIKFEKTPNGIVRSMGVVGEAQRWEPEEELADGCLNLTKVLNKNVVKDEIPSEPNTKPQTPPVVLAAQTPTPPPPVEFKIENSKEINLKTSQTPPQKMIATVRPYEFEITKKRRRLSKSCSEISPTCSSPSTSTLALSSLSKVSELSAAETKEGRASTPVPKAAKLHQPWLSPIGHQPDDDMDDDSNSSKRERTESFNSSTSTCDSVVGLKDDVDNNNVEPSSSSSQDAHSGRSDTLGATDPINKLVPSNLMTGLITFKPRAEFRQPSGAQAIDEGKAECNVCGKIFARASQLTLHMNIHYLERPFRCDPCGVSFRTKGHLIKHRRSSSHDCKVYLTEAWGVANEENPRPFKCSDCKIAFRIHGHLAKHLRSKMHIMRMECLGKLPFGIYFEMEKSGMNLNEIDTTDCDMSLVSLQSVAKKIYGDSWEERLTVVAEEPVV